MLPPPPGADIVRVPGYNAHELFSEDEWADLPELEDDDLLEDGDDPDFEPDAA